MAFVKQITTEHGVTFNKAYIRIESQSGGKDSINLRVRTYCDQQKCEAGFSWITESIHTFEPSVDEGSNNFIKQGYEYLKKLPEFESAIDVLE